MELLWVKKGTRNNKFIGQNVTYEVGDVAKCTDT